MLTGSAAGCNLQSRKNSQVRAGWQGNGKITLTSMITPSPRHSGARVTPSIGCRPVKNEVKRNKPHYPRFVDGAGMITGEMLSVPPGTRGNTC